jgi:hypothetical protein
LTFSTARRSAAAGINMQGGGNAAGYTAIADDSGDVIEVRPEYYGLLLFVLAGDGALLETQLSIGTVDASAYAVRKASGGVNLMVVNKDTLQNLTLTIETNQSIQTATQQTMTGPSLAAISGVTIQGAAVSKDGSFSPVNPIDPRRDPDNLLYPGSQRSDYQHYLTQFRKAWNEVRQMTIDPSSQKTRCGEE